MAARRDNNLRQHFLVLLLLFSALLLVVQERCVMAFVLHVPSSSTTTTTIATRRRAPLPLHAIQVSRVTNPADAESISEFFVSNFFDVSINKPKQKQQLKNEVYRDLTTRYISKVTPGGGGGNSNSKSALLVAKEGGQIVGCVGLETRVIREGQVTKYESVLKADAPGASVAPVLANLAVDRTLRRKGIGRKVLGECERLVKGWGYPELWLVVDEKNKNARQLYEKAGYELMSRDPRGLKVVPTEWQLKEVPVTNLNMRKDLKKKGAGGGGGLNNPFSFLGGLFGGGK